MILQTGALCTNASIEKAGNSYNLIGDPTEGAIVVAAEKLGLGKKMLEKQFERVHEIPFSSERKMMTTINRMKGGKNISWQLKEKN